MSRKVTNYTKEYKLEAVNLALKSPSISATARELGIPVATLYSWIKTLKNKTTPANADASSAKNIATIIEENRRLQKENSILREEKEILKKAATYFAQHQK
jgi:transposase